MEGVIILRIPTSMLWFSVTMPDGRVIQYELPDNDEVFTVEQWIQYAELTHLAVDYRVVVHCSSERV